MYDIGKWLAGIKNVQYNLYLRYIQIVYIVLSYTVDM